MTTPPPFLSLKTPILTQMAATLNFEVVAVIERKW